MEGTYHARGTSGSMWPPKPHISITSMRALDSCPRSWALRYAAGHLPLPPDLAAALSREARLAPGSPPALVGTVVDRTIKDAMERWARDGTRPAGLFRKAIEFLRVSLSHSAAWCRAVRSGHRPPDGPCQPIDRVWTGESWSDQEKSEVVEGMRLCLRHLENSEFLDLCEEVGPSQWMLAPAWPPAWFFWPIDDGGPPVPCWAAFDFIMRRPGGGVLVYDFKTGDPDKAAAITEQMAVYGAYSIYSLGVPREEVGLIPFWLRTGMDQEHRLTHSVLDATAMKVRQRHTQMIKRLRIAEEGQPLEAFPMTDDVRVCRSCVFQSCPGYGRTEDQTVRYASRRIPLRVVR